MGTLPDEHMYLRKEIEYINRRNKMFYAHSGILKYLRLARQQIRCHLSRSTDIHIISVEQANEGKTSLLSVKLEQLPNFFLPRGNFFVSLD